MNNPIVTATRHAYWSLARMLRTAPGTQYPGDFTPPEIAVLGAIKGKTLTTPERVVALIRAIEHVVNHRIPGDIVECGVWRGGSMMAAALTLMRLGDTTRGLYLYDTYNGMPPPTDADSNYMGDTAASQLALQAKDAEVWARAQLEEVKSNMSSTGFPSERVSFVEGKVEETIPHAAPERIALLRLDTDWYESTRHELEHLYPRLSPGGVLILDDYGHWDGARKAVDEFIAMHKLPLLLCRIDMAGRIAVKPR